MKNIKTWLKQGVRGALRWCREGTLLFLQWKDTKGVSAIITYHSANDFSFCLRGQKEDGRFRKINVRCPRAIEEYNKFMGVVDLSDQLIGKYNGLRQCSKWWKTLFFHMIVLARVNSYILLKDFLDKYPDVLKRGKSYSQLSFTEELIRELAAINDYDSVPDAGGSPKITPDHNIIPAYGNVRLNCKLCYKNHKLENKTFVKCTVCDLPFCFNKDRNCLVEYHNNFH